MSETAPKNQDALLASHRPPPTTRTPRHGAEIWRLHDADGHALVCELLDDSRSGAGYEVRLQKDGEIILGRRCQTRGIADDVAEAFRHDHLRTGWMPIDTP